MQKVIEMNYKLLLFFTIIVTCYEESTQSRTKKLREKIKQFMEMSTTHSIVSLNINEFKEYVKMPLKDYSLIVMLTAMSPEKPCAICEHMYDEYLIVANSFQFSLDHNDKIFFAIVKYDKGSDISKMLPLKTDPVIMHFPAKGKAKSADVLHNLKSIIRAEEIAEWIQDRTGVQIRVYRPPSSAKAFCLLFILVFGSLCQRINILEFLYDKQMWALAAVLFCCVFVSGQMWNYINRPPFYHKTKTEYYYIAGFRGQFVLETFIVAILNGAVVLGMILLIEGMGGVRRTKAARSQAEDNNFQSIVGLMLFCVFLVLLMFTFNSKK